jgi:predicted metalloprotease with PDZ domain
MRRNSAIRYRIIPARPQAHLFQVSCIVSDPDARGQRFALPAWSPGSYLIRDYARHIVSIRAVAGARQRPIELVKLDKHTWQAQPAEGPVRLDYEVYAWDLSVRGAHLDATHAFFNGPSVFMRVLGLESCACELDIAAPAGARYKRWRVATAMKRRGAKPWGFGSYAAADYDELIDHPVEMGEFALGRFRAEGVAHEIAITGRQDADMQRLCRDLERVCSEHIRFFGAPAPMDRYLFLATVVGEGYGGLEHRASTALLCSRNDLPPRGVADPGERYRGFLGLCSHEYFHTWNVKRIRPAVFTPYDLDRENYTGLLWGFEGITSYYDDLALVRCGLVSRKDYLELLARTITDHLRTPGRHRQSVAESSFDAWIKYYRQDENSPNAMVSYYGKGSLVALCLDLYIRDRTRGVKSLDDVMRTLWQRHGRTGAGVQEDGIESIAEEVTGLKLKRQFDAWVRSTAELPLKELLATQGVDMELRQAESSQDKGGKPLAPGHKAAAVSLGVRARADGKDTVVTHVFEGGAAQRAGIAAGDVMVAMDGLRLGSGGIDAALANRRPGPAVTIHAFRRDEMLQFEVTLLGAPRDTCVLTEKRAHRASIDRWLGRENEHRSIRRGTARRRKSHGRRPG